MSNLLISALRKVIPDRVRIPAFIVIVASLVTVVELLIKAYIGSLYDALGIYIPLIVVNCIILGVQNPMHQKIHQFCLHLMALVWDLDSPSL